MVYQQLSDFMQLRQLANELANSSGNNSTLSTSSGSIGHSSNSFATRVLLVSREEKVCVLKEYTIETEAQCTRFDAELRLLHNLRHPCVLSIESVFYDRNKAYIQMPFYDGHSLRQWIIVRFISLPPQTKKEQILILIPFSYRCKVTSLTSDNRTYSRYSA